MHGVEFLSDEWLEALVDAARALPAAAAGERSRVTIDHVVVDGPHWRLVIDEGSLTVEVAPEGDPDLRLTSDRTTAAAIASGRRAALDAFIAGDLRIGGDVRVLIENRAAMESLGDVFAAVRAETAFD